ncbi:MAG: hypothetical protein JWL70_134, partial [Acidimicrobiia bacterium]|nr:hypothetical protein [Acidimicrobiia bacterium]
VVVAAPARDGGAVVVAVVADGATLVAGAVVATGLGLESVQATASTSTAASTADFTR